MNPTPEQRAEFGRRLRTLRQGRGLTSADVAAALVQEGFDVGDRSVTGWERGEFGPRSIGIVRSLEAMFGLPAGELVSLLGDDGSIPDRLEAVEEEVKKLSALVRRLLRQRERG